MDKLDHCIIFINNYSLKSVSVLYHTAFNISINYCLTFSPCYRYSAPTTMTARPHYYNVCIFLYFLNIFLILYALRFVIFLLKKYLIWF